MRIPVGFLGQHFRPKSRGLDKGTLGQRLAAQSLGKAEVILDPGTRTCLSSGCFILDHQRPQTFRSPIDRRRQARQAGADDHQVIEFLGRLGTQPDLAGQFHLARLHQVGAIPKKDHRQLVVIQLETGEQIHAF